MRCPDCNSEAIVPVLNYDPSKHPIVSARRQSVNCPKCEEPMRRGFLVERNSPLQIVTLGEGLFWAPGEGGLMGDRAGLVSYACPNCGFVEVYIRRLSKDKQIILKGSL